jgi:hypothetical protein
VTVDDSDRPLRAALERALHAAQRRRRVRLAIAALAGLAGAAVATLCLVLLAC